MEPQNKNAQPQAQVGLKPTNQPVSNCYPQIEIEKNSSPNRIYALPLFGFLIKLITTVPVSMAVGLLLFFSGLLIMVINPFVVLITGKYWAFAFNLTSGIMKLGAQSNLFFYGITDQHPFSISADPLTWNLPYPERSSRLFAIPIFGFIVRIIFLIPFAIFSQVISYASSIAVFVTFIPVLFKKYYPETTHELTVDSIRISNALIAYMFGLSDKYPSFKISWNHKIMKIVLIVIGALFLLISLGSSFIPSEPTSTTVPAAQTIYY